LVISWQFAILDAESQMMQYDVRLGSSPGSDDIMANRVFPAREMKLNTTELALPHGAVAHITIVASNNANGDAVYSGRGIVIDLSAPKLSFSFGVPSELQSRGTNQPWPYPSMNASLLVEMHKACDILDDLNSLSENADPLLLAGQGDSENFVYADDEKLRRFAVELPQPMLRNALRIFDRTVSPISGGINGRATAPALGPSRWGE